MEGQVPAHDPMLPSLFDLYPGTEAMEREVYDLMGIVFVDHPDLTRILMGRGRPDPRQRPGLEALQKTSTGLSRLLASSCPTALPATPVDRLDTADRRLNSMLYAVVTLRAPLDALSSTPGAEKQQPQVSGLRR